MSATIQLLSILIPARDEEGCIKETLENLLQILRQAQVPFEILVVDDHSTDKTWSILSTMEEANPEVRAVQNSGDPGFGNGVKFGFHQMQGDAVVVYMADQSDDPTDVVLYWEKLNEGHDCVFGSRFVEGGEVKDYPTFKFLLNRFANKFIQLMFGIRLNDTTNAFKAYRKEVIDGCQPLLSPHFNLTVELPLKAIIRGYSWTLIPISWQNRKSGTAKFKIKEMGSRYIFIILYAWLEKYFARGDYHRSKYPQKKQKRGHTLDLDK
jgi:dolichol-phosphate mannosyltransferase